jgi:hypothetical protein
MPETIRTLNLGAFVVFDSAQRDATVNYLSHVLDQSGERQATCTVFDLRQKHGDLAAASDVPLY